MSDLDAMNDGSPEANPLLEAMRPKTTGNLLVVFKKGVGAEDRVRSLRRAGSALGLEVRSDISAAEMDGSASAGADFPRARVFERLGVAIVQPKRKAEISALEGSLRAAGEILEVRPEYYLFALKAFADTSDATWGLDATGIAGCPYTGKGIKLAILDTGLDRSHPDFAGRAVVERSFVADGSTRDIVGHGTHCAGSAAGPRASALSVPAYGCAPGAELHIGKVLNDSGWAPEGAVADGMQWALDSGCHIVSLSLGRSVRAGEPPTAFYERLGTDALASGCLMIAAAGNDSARVSGFIAPVSEPANSPSIMAVGAVDAAMEVAYFSNGTVNPGGGEVDIAGPGVGVFSSFPMPEEHKVLQGTSMACPHVAGIAALWAESDPALRGKALWQALIGNAKGLAAPRRDVGAGLVQAPQGRNGAVV